MKKYIKGMISLIILFAIITIIIIAFILKLNFLFIPLCLSLILESLLIIAGNAKRKKSDNNIK